MIVVDSSVWISHFSNVLHDEVVRLRNIARPSEIVVGDLILMELLRGARSDRHAEAIAQRLGLFDAQQMLDQHLAVTAARNYRYLRSRGVTVRSSIDVIIGTFCIERGYSLLQRDRDYLPMHKYLGLMLY
jgi:predicted nucleic acid-binding protein